MAHSHVTHLSMRGTATGASVRRRSQIVKRRRFLLLGMVALLLVMAVVANYGPLRAYVDARSRLASATASIAELSELKSEMQVELGRLSESEYLESLARQDLSYTRPGEELYIVTGTEDVPGQVDGANGDSTETLGVAAQSGGGASDGSPGFVERVLAPILD